MEILSVHTNYKIRGGEDESRESEERLLEKMGHRVDRYEESNYRMNQMNPISAATRTIWSIEAYQTMEQRLNDRAYNLVHVQNFFPVISPSIYYAARAKSVPVVQTLRNYRLLCPNALFFRHGRVCEDCLGKTVPLPGVIHSCYRQSRLASGVVATMITAHRALQTWNEMVDVYIALTEFARKKFIEGGLPQNKIVVKPNFVFPDPGKAEEKEDFALFVGRLSVEKGVDTLIAAWQQVGQSMPLKIIGEGPLEDQVIEAAQNISSIQWLGRKPLPDVYELMGRARLLIFPSKWYETFGRVAVEAFAKGTPVIASNLGAIAEIVEHGRTGLHFSPGDSEDLARQVEWALSHPLELAEMGNEARSEFEAKYTAKQNYQRLMQIYERICSA
ncbi:glycosyltransferase family 4 protein [Cyanobacteria bacterium FACHB-63]|nr:glycosyltransferase family 4 protein [Cyanobacteria bacterium FACHB-63]